VLAGAAVLVPKSDPVGGFEAAVVSAFCVPNKDDV
jgi:hypothetical protein